jgi:hypothetical protein
MEKQFLETKKIKDFTKRCLNNESIYDYKGSIAIIKDYWNKAKTINEFKDLVLNDKRLKDNQGYWELAKEDIQLYDRLVLEYLKPFIPSELKERYNNVLTLNYVNDCCERGEMEEIL